MAQLNPFSQSLFRYRILSQTSSLICLLSVNLDNILSNLIDLSSSQSQWSVTTNDYIKSQQLARDYELSLPDITDGTDQAGDVPAIQSQRCRSQYRPTQPVQSQSAPRRVQGLSI